MIIRKKRNSREVSAHAPNIGETLSDVPDIAPNPESRYAERERGRFLRDAISNLRPAIRRVVELQVLEDHSLGETAAHIGISVSAAKSRVFHAKVALRKSGVLDKINGTRTEKTECHERDMGVRMAHGKIG
jgi:DNA-directed RNA polymerase specialized sigma24 family protein